MEGGQAPLNPRLRPLATGLKAFPPNQPVACLVACQVLGSSGGSPANRFIFIFLWLRSGFALLPFDFLRLRLAAHGFALARRRSPSVVGSRQPLAFARLLFDFFSAWAIG